MLHFYVAYDKGVTDEASVAPPRQGFSAHQREAVFAGEGDDF